MAKSVAEIAAYLRKNKGATIGDAQVAGKTTSEQLKTAIEGLAPGGEYEKSMFADIDLEGRRTAANLESQAIGRGLGNVTTGISTVVGRQVTSQKAAAKRGMLESYIGGLQNLAGLEEQTRQFDTGVGTQQLQIGANLLMANKQTELAKKRLKAETETGQTAYQKYMANYMAQYNTPQSTTAINKTNYPSLYSSGSYGSGEATTMPSLVF